MPEPLRWDMILPNGEPLRYDMGPDFRWDGNVPEYLYPQNIMNDPNNKVSIVISPADKTMLLGHFQAVIDYFEAKGPALTAAQRKIQSIAQERAGMLDVFPAEMTANSQFRPSWIDMPEVAKDVTALREIMELEAKSDAVCQRIGDFSKLIGNDLLLAFNPHFGSTREAAKRNQPGALASYQRMAPYYPGGGGAPPTPPPTP
jgi:hypothetical protein